MSQEIETESILTKSVWSAFTYKTQDLLQEADKITSEWTSNPLYSSQKEDDSVNDIDLLLKELDQKIALEQKILALRQKSRCLEEGSDSSSESLSDSYYNVDAKRATTASTESSDSDSELDCDPTLASENSMRNPDVDSDFSYQFSDTSFDYSDDEPVVQKLEQKQSVRADSEDFSDYSDISEDFVQVEHMAKPTLKGSFSSPQFSTQPDNTLYSQPDNTLYSQPDNTLYYPPPKYRATVSCPASMPSSPVPTYDSLNSHADDTMWRNNANDSESSDSSEYDSELVAIVEERRDACRLRRSSLAESGTESVERTCEFGAEGVFNGAMWAVKLTDYPVLLRFLERLWCEHPAVMVRFISLISLYSNIILVIDETRVPIRNDTVYKAMAEYYFGECQRHCTALADRPDINESILQEIVECYLDLCNYAINETDSEFADKCRDYLSSIDATIDRLSELM